MDLASWLGGTHTYVFGKPPSASAASSADAGMAVGLGWLTICLSAAVAAGYVAVAVKWYFQRKLEAGPGGGGSRRVRVDSRAAGAHLVGLVVLGVACGYVFYATELAWRLWPVYDAMLMVLVWRTWAFALRTRGIGLVDARLAEVDELERSAQKFREIAEMLPHMVWTATADGTVDFSNPQWAAYAGPGLTWLDAAHHDERDGVHAWWADVVARREPAAREVKLRGARDDAF